MKEGREGKIKEQENERMKEARKESSKKESKKANKEWRMEGRQVGTATCQREMFTSPPLCHCHA